MRVVLARHGRGFPRDLYAPPPRRRHMKAAVYHGNGPRLAIEQMPTPALRDGDVLVRVAACGLCHTDLHYLDHGVPTFLKPPIILGHEAAGTVEQIGPAVSGVAVGDRMLAPSIWACGGCRYCRAGRENLCVDLVMPGNHMHGGFAEFLAVPAKELVRLPADLPLERACVIADAVSTPYHAVKQRAQVRVGDTVAVVGCGGVGLNVVQCAALAGATVIAVDLNDARLAPAAP